MVCYRKWRREDFFGCGYIVKSSQSWYGISRLHEIVGDTVQKGIKFRIYPNKQQKNLIDSTFGCCRLVYNKGLAMRNEAFQNGEKAGYSQTSLMLTGLKKQDDFSFLKEVDAVALQQSLRDLDRAFQNYFQKRAKEPCFKCKHDNRQSYRTMNQNDKIRIVGKYIRLPKLGFVKVRQSMNVSHINFATVERTPTGKYFVVLNVDFTPEFRQNAGGIVGIDVGLKEFYFDSNGMVVHNPKYLEHSLRKLVREQRRLSRKQKGSNNRKKQRVRVAGIHEKVMNQRNDFLHKQSTILVSENQTICIEDLCVKGMVRNHNLARAILSASWATFFTMLEYKAGWYGSRVIRVPTMYPSSQTCSCCGYKNSLVKDLKIRKWECPVCHTMHDRDMNASINILNKGLSIA